MDDRVFVKPSGLKRFERDDKVIYINPDVPSWFVTNKLGEACFDLFDGINTIDEIVEFCSGSFEEDCRDLFVRFCNEVVESGIFEQPSNAIKRPYTLDMVHLMLTDKCNLHCKYCYASERIESGYGYLSREDYFGIIDQLIDVNPSVSFTLSGGEPLLNDSWSDIASYIKQKGSQSLLLTNGLLIDDSNVLTIKSLFSLVTLSIDGSTVEIHSRTRGDNYNKLIGVIDLLERNEVNYSLSMTVSRYNIDDVEDMAKRFGNKLNYQPLFPTKGCSDSMSITGVEYYQALKKASGVNPLSYCEAALDRSKFVPCLKCAMGEGEISISATGDVYPCQLLHNDYFIAGNIHENSIREILRDSPVLKKCRGISVDTIDGCKDCAIKYICGGACRARSYYETKSIEKSGNFCEYEKNAYLDGIVQIYSRNVFN
ncbi:MAG: radical SAM protein [Marinilabiliaceae bacterium]|nr:radical SAM protein [Marinilabiliaceae bacterium]